PPPPPPVALHDALPILRVEHPAQLSQVVERFVELRGHDPHLAARPVAAFQSFQVLEPLALLQAATCPGTERAVGELMGQHVVLRSEEHTSELQSRENLV